MRPIFRFLVCGLVIAATSVPLANRAAALPFSQMFVFGDSLSDTGNVFLASGTTVPTPAAYVGGRFSNGPNWIDMLSAQLGLSMTPYVVASDPTTENINFAFGGAQTGISNLTPDGAFVVPGLNGQVGAFAGALGGSPANADALYVVWGGANDFLVAGSSPATVVGNISTAISGLYGLGARHILVPNLADLGATPLAQLIGGGAPAGLSAATAAFNALLAGELASLEGALPGIDLIGMDVYGLVASILADPASFGFSDPSLLPGFGTGPASGCLITFIIPTCSLTMPDTLTDYFWYDEMHPTTGVHALLTRSALSAIPEPAGMALFGLVALAGLLTVRRQRPSA